MNRIFNEILYLVTRAQGSEMSWWIVGVGWHWCVSFNIAKLLKFVACLIFRVAQLLCSVDSIYFALLLLKALGVCSVSRDHWDAGESHRYYVLPGDLQINLRASVAILGSTAWMLCRWSSITHLKGYKYWSRWVKSWSLWRKSGVWGKQSPRY